MRQQLGGQLAASQGEPTTTLLYILCVLDKNVENRSSTGFFYLTLQSEYCH